MSTDRTPPKIKPRQPSISARWLNKIRDMVFRGVVGGRGIDVRYFGNRIVIEQKDQKQKRVVPKGFSSVDESTSTILIYNPYYTTIPAGGIVRYEPSTVAGYQYTPVEIERTADAWVDVLNSGTQCGWHRLGVAIEDIPVNTSGRIAISGVVDVLIMPYAAVEASEGAAEYDTVVDNIAGKRVDLGWPFDFHVSTFSAGRLLALKKTEWPYIRCEFASRNFF